MVKDKMMVEENVFSTKKYVYELIQQLRTHFDDFLNVGANPVSDKKLIETCIEGLKTFDEEDFFLICGNDDFFIWEKFLDKWRPDLRQFASFPSNCFMIIALIQVLEREAKLKNGKNILDAKVNAGIFLVFEDYDKSATDKYHNVIKDYEGYVKQGVLELRIGEIIKEESERNVRTELNGLRKEIYDYKGELDKFESDSKERFEKAKGMLDENEALLNEIKNKTGFLALYSGFKDYANEIEKKINHLNREKNVWIFSILGVFLIGMLMSLLSNFSWLKTLPLIGAVVLCSTMLKVNLKKIDQFEQTLTKVKHKLAVSTFYQNELKESLKEKKVNPMDDEYYRFLFSEIETTDWNTPDLVSDVASILKSYKSK